jgi:c-di-GMP-binding flagellar brake protein YcgR
LFWKRKKDKKEDLPFSLEYDEDQRSYYRVAPKRNEPLFLQTRDKRYAVLDVSAGGVAFEGAGFSPGGTVSAVLAMPGDQAPIPMVLTVVKVTPGKMIAGQFREIKDEDRERVHQYVLKRQKEELEKQRLEKLTEAKHQAGPKKRSDG